MLTSVNRNWARHRPARRHLLGDPPGYSHRLCRAHRGRHWPGNAELLAGNYGHALPGTLVGLVAISEADSLQGRPAGESWDVPHSGRDSGDSHVCRHHADDAHHDAGGAPAGLHQDGLVEGTQGGGGCHAARHQECPHPSRDPDRPAAPPPDRGLRYLGADIRSAGDRPYVCGCPR